MYIVAKTKNQPFFLKSVKFDYITPLSDYVEISKQIRILYTRSNKLLRMFSYCTIDVKKELFRSYCSSLYCCALWSDYRKATYRK